MDLSKARQCRDKAKHGSRAAAQAEKNYLVQKGGVHFLINVYRCDHCRFWHVGRHFVNRRNR